MAIKTDALRSDPGSRPRGPGGRAERRDTRAEILAVASELFVQQGYDATSLREISERLGITKAALYYHFESKEEILSALLAPVVGVLEELVERLEAAGSIGGWADVLDWLVDTFVDHRDFMQLLERNRHAIEDRMEATFHGDDAHLRIHERVGVAAHRAAANLSEEVRMFAALGAITAFDDWAPQLIISATPEVIRTELTRGVRALLGLPDPRRRTGRSSKSARAS
jgi:AcrR family transcriptional regulator